MGLGCSCGSSASCSCGSTVGLLSYVVEVESVWVVVLSFAIGVVSVGEGLVSVGGSSFCCGINFLGCSFHRSAVLG